MDDNGKLNYREAIEALLEHARRTDGQIATMQKAVMVTNDNVIRLSGAVEELSGAVKDLLLGLRGVIDRIPATARREPRQTR